MTREKRPFVALGFASTHDALDAETLLADMGIDVVPIPAPQSISAGCGMALRLTPDEEARAEKYLSGAGIVIRARVDILDV